MQYWCSQQCSDKKKPVRSLQRIEPRYMQYCSTAVVKKTSWAHCEVTLKGTGALLKRASGGMPNAEKSKPAKTLQTAEPWYMLFSQSLQGLLCSDSNRKVAGGLGYGHLVKYWCSMQWYRETSWHPAKHRAVVQITRPGSLVTYRVGGFERP